MILTFTLRSSVKVWANFEGKKGVFYVVKCQVLRCMKHSSHTFKPSSFRWVNTVSNSIGCKICGGKYFAFMQNSHSLRFLLRIINISYKNLPNNGNGTSPLKSWATWENYTFIWIRFWFCVDFKMVNRKVNTNKLTLKRLYIYNIHILYLSPYNTPCCFRGPVINF